MPKLSTTETIGVIGSIFSIASVILYGIDKLFAKGNNLMAIGFFVLLASILLLFAFFSIKLQNKFKNLNTINVNKLKESYMFFHQITHSFRDSIWEIQNLQQYYDKRTKDLNNNMSQIDLHNHMRERSFTIFKEFANSITGTIVDSLGTLFHADGIEENFRVTIKLLIPENNKTIKNWSVMTACRDPNSVSKVNKIPEEPCVIGENTDFFDIAYAGKRVFASNDLLELTKTNSYKNSSTNWQNRYNSTLVLPIRYMLEEKNNNIIIEKPKLECNKPIGDDLDTNVQRSDIIYGFLAADSKNVNNNPLFSNDLNSPVVNLIAHSADLLAIWFRYWEQHCEKLHLKN